MERHHQPRDGRERGRQLKHRLGVSLSEGHLAFVCLRLALGRAEVAAVLRLPLPQNADEETAFLQELAAFLIANRVPAGVAVTLGVPRADFLLRRFETPPVKPASLPELVGFEAERHLPGRREEFLLGWRVDGRTAAGGYAILLGAARTQALERAIALLGRANLAPASIQPESFALAAGVRAAAPEARRALVVDVGSTAIGVDLVEEGRVRFSRVIPIDDVPWRESYASPQAGGGEGSPTDAAAERRHEATLRVGAALVERLNAPLFRETLPDGALPEVLLTGPGAARSRFVGSLQEGLGVPVRAVSLWPLVQWGAPPAELSPYTNALALALQGEGGPRGLELAVERQEALHRAPSMRTTAALAVLLTAVVASHLVSCGLRQQQRLAQLDGEIGVLKTRMGKVEAVNRRLQGQRAQLGYLEKTITGRARQSDLMRELTGLLPDAAYLTEYSFRERTIEITGLAPSASQLLPVLEASPLFSGVEFSAPIVAQGAGLERFRIRLRLESAGG